MDGVRTRANNAPPLAGAERHRNLPKKLYRLGLGTSATAVGGLVERLVAASARSRQAEDVPVPLSQLTLFFLLVTLLVGLTTLYVGRWVEAATPRGRKAGVAIYFLCSLLLGVAVSLVGSVYWKLALDFIDD